MVNPNVFGRLFSGLSNYVTFSPQNLVINDGTSVSSDPVSNVLDGISLEQLLE